MKKFLLSAAALMAAMTMNAQEVCVFNADNAMGLDSENGTALTAGTVLGETASIVQLVAMTPTSHSQLRLQLTVQTSLVVCRVVQTRRMPTVLFPLLRWYSLPEVLSSCSRLRPTVSSM